MDTPFEWPQPPQITLNMQVVQYIVQGQLSQNIILALKTFSHVCPHVLNNVPQINARPNMLVKYKHPTIHMLHIDKHNKIASKSFKPWTTVKTTILN